MRRDITMNIHLTFDESLKDVFSALCKDIQQRLGVGGLQGEEIEACSPEIKVSTFLQISPHPGGKY